MFRSTMNAIAVGVALAAGGAPLAAHAQETVVVETVTATTYLNGGVGKDERASMQRMAKEFPLRMTFSERKDGELVADVPVVVSDAKGSPVFMLPKAGPLLYVMLPDGKYTVRATWKGKTESQEVTIAGKTGKDVSFHWAGAPRKG
jgi:uncharacterized protein (DUF427 family)